MGASKSRRRGGARWGNRRGRAGAGYPRPAQAPPGALAGPRRRVARAQARALLANAQRGHAARLGLRQTDRVRGPHAHRERRLAHHAHRERRLVHRAHRDRAACERGSRTVVAASAGAVRTQPRTARTARADVRIAHGTPTHPEQLRAYENKRGGFERGRTSNPRLRRPVLYPLSYESRIDESNQAAEREGFEPSIQENPHMPV
jgi:hypothetical protein